MNYPGIIKEFLRYHNQIKRYKEYQSWFYNILLYKFFFKWKYFKKQNDSLKFKIPWITFPSYKYLKRKINSSMRIFEYGCGGSTLFFAKYGNEIISIEHDHEWYKKMSEYLNDNNINNVILKYFKPEREVDVEKLFLSHNEEYEGLSFRKYVNAIDDYPDKYFDIILIDGRARTACFIKSQKKVKDNGIIVWDNTERKRYRDGFLLGSKKFKKIELPGPTPYTKSFTITTIFKLA